MNRINSWWRTLRGILTSLAAVITAITGLIIGLQQVGILSNRQTIKQPAQISSPAAGKDTPASPESKVGPKPDNTSSAADGSSGHGTNRLSIPKGMGTLRTSSGEFEFDRITDMSMGNGKLTVSQFGSKIEIPLKKIKRIVFQDENAIRIDYWNGDSEVTNFDCYWNLPVRFYAGVKVFYYGDCRDFSGVKEIEFDKSE